MSELEQLETEIKELIIEALVLEDLTPEEIQNEEPLFADGLGLDSIDALEIALVLEQNFGIVTGEDDEAVREHFASIRNLARYVVARRTK